MMCNYPDLGVLIGRAKWEICFNQKHYQDLGSDTSSVFVSQMSLHRETSGGITKCWQLSSQVAQQLEI